MTRWTIPRRFRQCPAGRVLMVLILALGCVPASALAGGSSPMIEQISVDSEGNPSEGISGAPDISSGGRYVAFTSNDETLAPADKRFEWVTVFLRDITSGETIPVSLSRSGGGPTHQSFDPHVSADGRFVLFDSAATNLVWGQHDANDGSYDIFLRDMERDKNFLITRSPHGYAVGGAFNHDISADGSTIVFDSSFRFVDKDRDIWDDVYAYDRNTRRYSIVSLNGSRASHLDNNSWDPAVSRTGRFITFDSESSNLARRDSNDAQDVFLSDRKSGELERISVSSQGEEGNDYSWTPQISGNGRFVVFMSDATNLVWNDTEGVRDIFVHDRKTGKTRRVSRRPRGRGADQPSFEPDISPDGRFVTFRSRASNLVAEDTDGVDGIDVFMVDLETWEVSLVTKGCNGDSRGKSAVVSRLGRRVAFSSTDSDLVDTDAGGDLYDVFLRRMNGSCPE